jgi:hypothetical protein
MNSNSRRAAAVVAVLIGTCIPIATASASTDGVSLDRSAASGGPALAEKPGIGAYPKPSAMMPRKGCKLSCVKRTLVALIKSHNKLVKAYNGLAKDYYRCETITPVTQYGDYMSDVGGTISGLDFTAEGDTVDEYMVVYVC